MGRFANTHPKPLTRLVGEAIANGATVRDVHEQLAAGTFHGVEGPYHMPLETVRYYGKRARQQRQAKAVSPTARDNPRKAVDDLARLLLTAAQRGLEEARPQIDKDPKALKEWGDALKTIQALVKDGPADQPTKGKTRTKPTDPLSARLLTPSQNTPREDTQAQPQR